MGSLFAELARKAAMNARREVETYAREIPEFALLDANPRARAETLEYAVWLRHRTNELAPTNSALTDADLDCIASMGEARGGTGLSLDSRQRILRLHTALMLREINEATDAQRGGDAEELLRMMSWFAPQGERGIGAYRRGFVTALRRRLPYGEQVALLTRSLLTADAMAAELAASVGMELPERCAVTVIRAPDRPTGDHDLDHEIEALAKTHQVPLMWCPQPATATATDTGPGTGNGRSNGRGGELIALIPLPPGPHNLVPDPLTPTPLVHDLVHDFAQTLGRPCAAGTATAPLSDLADALDRARRISRAAPLRRAPAPLEAHTMADVFVELATADIPHVDDWLRAVARRLDPGPDLVATLDAYYRHDMNRATTAAALNVHPRTLDYRLRRVRELTGIPPTSTRGVRILSAVVTRRLSGAWP
ncbi:PucR family transcriptional regulator [Streptomyces sp. NPDC059063]|uniref:PucR family transcriptional regulator n=1 Tax=unclassified Streptomyces TaxID=2593676 RepID=UPI0036B18991